jgi:hypothetical protein
MGNFYDFGVGLADDAINAALAINEQVQPAPSQFVRQGKTSQWFSPRSKMLKGERTRFRVFDKGYRGARRTGWSAAATSEGPVPMAIGHTECSYSYDDLSMIRAGVKWSMLQETKHTDLNLAVYDLVNKLFGEAEADIAETENTGLFLPQSCAMATVTQIYDADGTTFTGAAGHAAAYITISGNPGRFQKGDVLAIYDATSTGGSDVQNAQVVVHDVVHGTDGPKVAGGTRVASIGPGLVVEPCDSAGAVEASNWNGATVTTGDTASFTSATPAVGDFIARTHEFTTSATSGAANNFHGLPDWFDWSVGTLRNGDGTYLTRTDPGYEWTNPFVVEAGTAAEPVEFDPDEHLAELAENWIFRVKAGRAGRKTMGEGMPSGVNEQIQISEHLLAIMEPKMLQHVSSGAEDKLRFTAAAQMSESSAKALEMIGVSGFEGYVWHSPILGEVCMKADTNCKPHSAYIVEPSSFFWIDPPGGSGVKWLPHGSGGRIWPIAGSTNGTPTFERQAMAYKSRGLMCDQPAANSEIRHILTAREAAAS